MKNGKDKSDWIYYCKLRYLGKLYNFEIYQRIWCLKWKKQTKAGDWLKDEAKKAIELGLQILLKEKKIKDLYKSKIIEEKLKEQ